MKELNEYLPWISIIVTTVGGVATLAVMKYRIKVLETNRKEDKDETQRQLESVRISKNSRIKEIKEDYNEKIQVVHGRVDKVRDEVRENHSKVETKLEKLGEKIEAGNQKLLEHVTLLITGQK